jgi:hypothetical protein
MPKPPARRFQSYPAPTVPEVVRIQRTLLQEPTEDGEDLETWTHAHLLRECINPKTKEKTVILRYENGDVEEVYEGAVYRPERVHDPQRKSRARQEPESRPTSSSAEQGLPSHVRRDNSPPPPCDAHDSSVDDVSDEEVAAMDSSNDPVSASSDNTLSDHRPTMPMCARETARKRRRQASQSSDSTLSESEYQLRRRDSRLGRQGGMRSREEARPVHTRLG